MNEALGIIKRYFEQILKIVKSPSSFFKHLSTYEGLTRPLTFAMITNWLGSAFYFIWNGADESQTELSHWIQDWIKTFEKSQGSAQYETWLPQATTTADYQAWAAGLSSVLLSPFVTLFTVLFSSVLIFVASRIFTARETKFISAVQISSYAQATQIFMFIPWVGTLIATVYRLVLLVIGAKQIYRIGSMRASIIAFFPYLISVGMMAVFIMFSIILGFILISLLASMAVV